MLHVALLKGRTWDESETMRGAHLAVINQTMAREYWPDGDVLGRQIRMPQVKNGPFLFCGVWKRPVVRDRWQLSRTQEMMAWQIQCGPPSNQCALHDMVGSLFAHLGAQPGSPCFPIALEFRTQVRCGSRRASRGTELHLGRVARRDAGVAAGASDIDAPLALSAFVALVLALVGLYSVVSYSVVQRTGEFGIRMALGAQRADVLWLIFSATAFSAGSGLAVGILLSLSLTPLLAQWTEGSSCDPLLLLFVALLLIGASTLACLLTARRASLIDPATALRCE